ncbi:TRAP transporter permease [Falsiroseomonas sp.]|uniref:TRAP transporter permease n=1 Tax=Falsiroseomonas sp. TaxID=2870721 RepID=UPI00356678BC
MTETAPGSGLASWLGQTRTLIAVAMSAYHLWTGFFGAPVGEVHYPLHLLLALLVLFLARGQGGPVRPLGLAWDFALIGMTAAATGYLFANARYVTERMLFVEPLTTTETVLAIGLLVVVLEAARRTVGWVLVGVLGVFIAYALFGNVLPGALWHRGYSVEAVLEYSYLTTEGIFGAPLAVMANYVFHFVLFGSLLAASGAGDFFTNLARALTARTVGGAAKSAVVASTFMGMLSGSSAANVVTTGAFTIPAMKRSGYNKEFAAGVEAVASSGGQVTPPIMGAAAFIMMEFTGASYATIMGISVIPAALYALAVFIMVDLEARRMKLAAFADPDAPTALAVLKRQGYLLIAIIVMIWVLVDGYTPTTAAVWAIATLVALLVLMDPVNRRRILKVCWEAMADAPRLVAPVTVACAVGGILIGIIGQTGLGLRLSGLILDAAGGQTIVLLVLTTIMGIILGMGMPTSGAYIIMAALLAPGLVQGGVPLLAAHMFIMWVASKSSITPPVAIASYAAAAVAGSDPWRTSWVAFRLGLSIFIIPYMFVFGPQLLGMGEPLEIALAAVTASLGIFALSVAIIGWLFVPLGLVQRLVFGATSLLLIKPGSVTDLAGIALILAFGGLAWLRRPRVAGA